MAKCKSGKCGCRTRIVSNAVQNLKQNECIDVCTNPICGSPNMLSLYAPLIYDEIGINLCSTFELGVDIPTAYPTATTASAQVVDVTYTYGEGNVVIEAIQGRTNCYSVTLSNLTVELAVNLYDDASRLLDTIFVSTLYLPPVITDPAYDEDTNPTLVELEIFAPYGISYNGVAGDFTPALNYIGFLATDNFVRQGLNLYVIPKALNLDTADSTITVGLTLVLQSLYFAGYNVASAGKINTPKGSLIAPEDTDCMRFVAGDLLNLAIKPLELGMPSCEENLKQNCKVDCMSCNGYKSVTEGQYSSYSEDSNCGCNDEHSNLTLADLT